LKQKIKILHIAFFLIGLILVIRFVKIIDLGELLFQYFLFFVYDFSGALSFLNLPLIDAIISIKLFIIVPICLYVFRRSSLLNKPVSFSIFVTIVLIFVFIFAPLLAEWHPDFQKDVTVTKFLPPFSKVDIIYLSSVESKPLSREEKFLHVRDKAITKSFNDNLLFADSISYNSKVVKYFQDGFSKEISTEKVVAVDGIPKIEQTIFWLGTDEFGRDVLARIIYGTRISLLVGSGSVIISLILGLGLGFLSGYSGGFTDTVLSRLTEMFLSFPIIFLVVMIIALFGNSLLAVIIVLGFSGWMSLFKIVKSEVASVKKKDFFLSARLIGLSGLRLLLRELLPVMIAPVLVNLVFQFGYVILAESTLSFLGLGTGTEYPSWGAMIQAGQQHITKAWWMIIFPGSALIAALISANNIGRSLIKQINSR
jgi:peptide/nickel transport system permease protein